MAKKKSSGKYANKSKSGSTSPRNYDPKNSNVGGSKKPKVTRMYSPTGNNTPSAPGSRK